MAEVNSVRGKYIIGLFQYCSGVKNMVFKKLH